jgi:hypothetical protein
VPSLLTETEIIEGIRFLSPCYIAIEAFYLAGLYSLHGSIHIHISSFLKDILGNMNLAELAKAGQNELPDHPIKVGDSWTVEQKVPVGNSGQTIATKTIYTLVGFEDMCGTNTAKLDTKSAVQVAGMKLNVTDPQGKPLALTMDLKEDIKGTTWFCQTPSVGLVLRSCKELKKLSMAAFKPLSSDENSPKTLSTD